MLPACQCSPLDAWIRNSDVGPDPHNQIQWGSGPTVSVVDPDPVGLASVVPDPDPYQNKKSISIQPDVKLNYPSQKISGYPGTAKNY